MKIKAYIHHKEAEQYCDCQDFFGIDKDERRIAVSDGMTQSIYPQWWAEILVEAYLKEGKFPQDESLEGLRGRWLNRVGDEIERRKTEGKNHYRLENSIADRLGACATFCGFSWSGDEWQCDCLGDSSLITITEVNSIEIFSSQDGAFDNYPDYFDSMSQGKGTPEHKTGKLSDYKYILLVSDPFSELFQKNSRDKDRLKHLIDGIASLTDHDSFVSLVETWRSEYSMHNDDSTLVVLSELSKIDSVDIEHEDDLEALQNQEANTSTDSPANATPQSSPKPKKEPDPFMSDIRSPNKLSQKKAKSKKTEKHNKKSKKSKKSKR